MAQDGHPCSRLHLGYIATLLFLCSESQFHAMIVTDTELSLKAIVTPSTLEARRFHISATIQLNQQALCCSSALLHSAGEN